MVAALPPPVAEPSPGLAPPPFAVPLPPETVRLGPGSHVGPNAPGLHLHVLTPSKSRPSDQSGLHAS